MQRTFSNNVSSSNPFKNVLHVTRMNSQLLGPFFSFFGIKRLESVPYFSYLLLRQFGLVMVSTICKSSSSFCFAVSNIIQWSAQKQMIGIYASRIIAMMKNLHFMRNFAFVKFKRESVCKYLFIVSFYHSISRSIQARRPFPASIRSIFVYSGPKSIHPILLHFINSGIASLDAYFASSHKCVMPRFLCKGNTI